MAKLCVVIVLGSVITSGLWSGFASNRQNEAASISSKTVSESMMITGYRSVMVGKLSKDTLIAIANQVNLESLELTDCSIEQSDYMWFADLRALRFLSVRNTGIRDAGFSHFAGLKNLEELELCSTEITNKCLAIICTFPKLRKLKLDLRVPQGEKNKIDALHLAQLKELRALELTIEGTDEELRSISTITNLEELTLNAVSMTQSGLSSLSALKNLRRLHVQFNNDPKSLLSSPSLKFPNLEKLELSRVPISDAWATQLMTNCPKIECLKIHSSQYLSDIGVATIASLPFLRHLSLSDVSAITDHSVECISSISELRHLCITNCQLISDKSIVSIARLRNLRSLDMSCLNISNNEIKQLSRLNLLEKLDISTTSVTDAAVPVLVKLSQLRELWIIQT